MVISGEKHFYRNVGGFHIPIAVENKEENFMSSLSFYNTREYAVATNYLHTVGLDSIRWEEFEGDFDSVLNYLEKISSHIYEKWGTDTTYFYTEVTKKSAFRGWNAKYLPSEWQLHSHFIVKETGVMSDDRNYKCDITILDVHTLQLFENQLHAIIMEELDGETREEKFYTVSGVIYVRREENAGDAVDEILTRHIDSQINSIQKRNGESVIDFTFNFKAVSEEDVTQFAIYPLSAKYNIFVTNIQDVTDKIKEAVSNGKVD